jgi:hypothetical protein
MAVNGDDMTFSNEFQIMRTRIIFCGFSNDVGARQVTTWSLFCYRTGIFVRHFLLLSGNCAPRTAETTAEHFAHLRTSITAAPNSPTSLLPLRPVSWEPTQPAGAAWRIESKGSGLHPQKWSSRLL